MDTYKSILSAVEASGSEKRLAAQFIPRFFKYFPTLAEQAINAQLDLCEDDDSSVRLKLIAMHFLISLKKFIPYF